jgi:tetratricopeptide (TPR) repeat protein
MYPAVREDHLRYLEKLGLVRAVERTRGERYYGFADLAVIKQAAAELSQGTPFRQVLRSLEAARRGQLEFDFEFRGGRTDAEPARVLTLGRPAEARPEAASREATELPLASDPQARLAAKYFLEGASLDGDEQQRAAAAVAYRRALVVDPDLVPALVNLANIHYAGDELIEAQALYERAIRIEPDCFEAYFNLGNIHHDLGRYEEAIECYREAVALNAAFPEAHFYLAVTLEKLARSPEARPHWKAYQQLAPDGEWVELAKEFSE